MGGVAAYTLQVSLGLEALGHPSVLGRHRAHSPPLCGLQGLPSQLLHVSSHLVVRIEGKVGVVPHHGPCKNKTHRPFKEKVKGQHPQPEAQRQDKSLADLVNRIREKY